VGPGAMESPGAVDLLTSKAANPELPELVRGPVGRFGIYVHCLFCLSRCPYCDFNVAIYREDRVAPFVAALRSELARYARLPWAGRVPAVEADVRLPECPTRTSIAPGMHSGAPAWAALKTTAAVASAGVGLNGGIARSFHPRSGFRP